MLSPPPDAVLLDLRLNDAILAMSKDWSFSENSGVDGRDPCCDDHRLRRRNDRCGMHATGKLLRFLEERVITRLGGLEGDPRGRPDCGRHQR